MKSWKLMCMTALPALSAACGGPDPDEVAPDPGAAADGGAIVQRERQPISEAPPAPPPRPGDTAQPGTEGSIEVTAPVSSAEGEEIGSLGLKPVDEGVQLDLHVEGLEPGIHAVHFHQRGECGAPEFKSAGGHYNPADGRHGRPDDDQDFDDPAHHAGDMLNQEVTQDGVLDVVMINRSVTIGGARNPLLDDDGSALVIHAGADDYQSQPSGDAGPRVACAELPSAG